MTTDLDGLKGVIEATLARLLPDHSPIAPDLVAAMRYATLSGGKRLRPMLVCAACTGVGGRLAHALAPACAVEFVHAYSLVHDDLPAMDDDDLRHGVPSNHVRFGEATAILAGDALQALAFQTLAQAPDLSDPVRLRTLTLLTDAVGWRGMVGGQSFDLAAEARALAQEELAALHGAKTGALIRAAVQIGAVVGDPDLPAATFDILGAFGTRLGLAFQVIDDVLDVTASTAELGKPAGSDLLAEKSTYPKLLGVDGARALADRLLAEALDLLGQAGLQNDWLAQLAHRGVRRAY
ncbi:MAG: polyprenyl synthetase family protein [Pseudomonadales bacterium]|nr:polyprenyl synthetase family protein [Pseudomonadales bacterium]